MLTKVVEPGLGFLVLFTNSNSRVGPKYFLRKLVKMKNHLLTSTEDSEVKNRNSSFCTKTQEIDRQIVLASDWRRNITFWRRHIGHSIQKWSITEKDLVQPQNYFPGNGSKQCNRAWRIQKSRFQSLNERCLRCSECRTRQFKNC